MQTTGERRRFMLIGEIGAGKTTLLNALLGRDEEARKTQTIEFEGDALDTPGEYFSHPRLYSALLCVAADVSTLVYVHPATSDSCRLPPGLLDVYADKDVVGVITKTDLPDADADAVEAMLNRHGIANPIYRVSPGDAVGLNELRRRLAADEAIPRGAVSR